MTNRVVAHELEILLPVHNEAGSIEATIREFYSELPPNINFGFIICEDGSKDYTKAILRRLALEIPMRLNLSDERKGYSRAVREGMKMLQADWLLCVDSDGQCDPKDFGNFWKARESADVLLGWRVDRQDTFARKCMSRFFYLIYQAAFHTPALCAKMSETGSPSTITVGRRRKSHLGKPIEHSEEGYFFRCVGSFGA